MPFNIQLQTHVISMVMLDTQTNTKYRISESAMKLLVYVFYWFVNEALTKLNSDNFYPF